MAVPRGVSAERLEDTIEADGWNANNYARAQAAEARASKDAERIRVLEEVLKKAEAWFRDYEQQHLIKATVEGAQTSGATGSRTATMASSIPTFAYSFVFQ